MPRNPFAFHVASHSDDEFCDFLVVGFEILADFLAATLVFKLPTEELFNIGIKDPDLLRGVVVVFVEITG